MYNRSVFSGQNDIPIRGEPEAVRSLPKHGDAMIANSRALGRFLDMVTLLLLAPVVLLAAHQTAATPPPEYGVAVVKNVMVRMRDGVKLATDVYLPSRDGAPAPGKFPVLIERTPYGKEGQSNVATASFFARHGYVDLVQDVRGRFASQGTFISQSPG